MLPGKRVMSGSANLMRALRTIGRRCSTTLTTNGTINLNYTVGGTNININVPSAKHMGLVIRRSRGLRVFANTSYVNRKLNAMLMRVVIAGASLSRSSVICRQDGA